MSTQEEFNRRCRTEAIILAVHVMNWHQGVYVEPGRGPRPAWLNADGQFGAWMEEHDRFKPAQDLNAMDDVETALWWAAANEPAFEAWVEAYLQELERGELLELAGTERVHEPMHRFELISAPAIGRSAALVRVVKRFMDAGAQSPAEWRQQHGQ